MYGYGYRYNSGLVIGAGGGAPFLNTYSLDFDGVDDYVDGGNVWNLSTYTWSPFTLSFWYKGTNPIVGAVHLVSLLKFAPSQFLGLYDGYAGAANVKLYLNFGGQLNIAWTVGSNGTVDLFDDQWHNVTIVFPSGSNDGVDATNAQMYIDNTLMAKVGSGIMSPPVAAQTWNTFQIMEGEWNPLGGLVDEVALWKTDETSSVEDIYNLGTPTDLSLLATPPLNWYRNGDNGSWKSPQWLIPNNENKDKVSNYSMDFDGTDDYVDCGVISTFQSTANFSISCWLKVPSLGANNFFIGTYLNASNTIYGYITSSGEIVFNINTAYQRLSGTTAVNKIAVGLWYNITFVFDGSLGYPNGMLIYLNGVATTGIGVSNPLPTVTSANGGLTFIGGLNAGGLRFNGTMDEVSFYDYSLSSAEALAIGGTVPTDLSLLATPPTNYYKMADNSTFLTNWTVPDEVGSNDGTSANMTIEDRIGEAPNSTSNALSFNMDEVDRVTDVPT